MGNLSVADHFGCRPIDAGSKGAGRHQAHQRIRCLEPPNRSKLNLNLVFDGLQDSINRYINWNTIYL